MEEPMIKDLPDDLILKIFSLLPMFKESAATHLISKLCKGGWELEPDVMFNDHDESYDSLLAFLSFVYGSLLFNKPRVLERLHLKLSRNYSASDINFLVNVSVNRSVRKLRIQRFGKTLELPSCLSTCITLKSLILQEVSIEVVPPCFCLPSLKSLHLLSVKFSGDKSIARLLQICPLLEYLVINQTQDDNVMMFKVISPRFRLPSLKSLHFSSVKFLGDESVASLLQICPVLEYLVVNQTKDDNVMMFKVIPPRFRLPSLKSLHLSSVKFSGDECVVRLLQSCPVLEYLVVNQTKCDDVMFRVVPPRFRLSSLKSLHLLSVKFSGDESVASLLKSCPVLEYLVVSQTKCDNVMFRVVPPMIVLSSLKSLHLFSVNFFSGESVERLLGNCKALEELVIKRTKDDNVMIFNINVPTLKSLTIDNSRGKRAYVELNHGFVINAPALEKLNFKDTFSNFLIFEYMPEVTTASIEVICDQSEKFIGSLTSVEHLSLCSLTSETPYPKGSFFFFLEHLELCTCSAGWANLLACILTDAPRLQSLKLKSKHRARYNDPMNFWNEPTIVPECLSTHLENLEWSEYEGTEQERKVAAYILANATCLKMATFSTRCRNKHHRMLRKLKKMQRVSETCQLAFV